jgi:hypothetical protein
MCMDGAWVSNAVFFESARSDSLSGIAEESILVVRLSFGVLISVSLALTVYFGAAAWRLTGDAQNESNESGPPFYLVRPQLP